MDDSFEKMYIENKTEEDRKVTNFEKFCTRTKLHGFDYLAAPNENKFFWKLFILLSFSLSLCVLIILCKIKSEPTVILQSNLVPIWDVPFPAITICPETKIKQSVYNFTEYYHKIQEGVNLTTAEFQAFSDSSLVCDNHLHLAGNKTTDKQVIRHIKSVAPTLKDVFFACKLKHLSATCDQLFTSVITDDGVCFTSKNNSLKTSTSGAKGGFFIVVKDYEEDLDYICRGPVQGFKVLLHPTEEKPRISTHYFRAPLNQEVVVIIKPTVIKTDDKLKNYSPQKRMCFFENEQQLKFFKNYNEENCRIECLTNLTLQNCGCVAYYMPRDESSEVCGSGSNQCLFKTEQELMMANSPICNCLPACNSVIYHSEISQADFNWRRVLKSFKSDEDEFPGIHMSRLSIFFKHMQTEGLLRTTSSSNWTEILALSGGIFAFFTGFSFLTVAEILYFCLMKLLCNVKNYSRQQ